jgi:type III secretory pathway component EscR
VSEAALPGWTAIAFLAALPLVLAAATAFTKSSVLLGALRVGLGAEALLPMAAVIALALVVTAVVMGPTAVDVLDEVEARGGFATLSGSPAAWLDALEPWRAFLFRHCDAAELEFFAELQGKGVQDPIVVVPAFLVTELGEALAMAVVVLVPLVVVDLVVAQALALLGLAQMPVQLVAVPLKLLLFLAVGGWDVIVGGLVQGYT